MHRLILILPGLFAESGDSVLASPPSGLRQLASGGEVLKIDLSRGHLPSFLGLDPAIQLEPGPQAVAAFGADPPDRSVHFQLTLVSLVDQVVSPLELPIAGVDFDLIISSLRRLDTSKLTLVPGHDRHHALVWEDGSIELGTTSLGALPAPFRSSLPYGDGENLLRRYIDDSVNLLSELEFNRMRIDQGLPPINCAWLWGQGFRERVENLALTYGIPAEVESGSFALAGIARLAGLHHGDWKGFDRGTATPLRRLATPKPMLIAVVGAFERFRRHAEIEEMGWFLSELSKVVLEPWMALKEPTTVSIVALGDSSGLALRWSNGRREEGLMPFDERAFHEPIETQRLDQFVRRAAMH